MFFTGLAMLSLWAKTSGTWINVLSVIIGSSVGMVLRHRLPQSMQQIITQAVGLMTLVIGFAMVRSLAEVEAGLIDGIYFGVAGHGGRAGSWGNGGKSKKRLTQLGDQLKARVKGGGKFTEGFVAASLLFCIGPMTILGSINNGLSGDNTLLTLKATMDGLASVALTGSYGIGVLFSALTVLVVQGSISLLAGLFADLIPDPATDPHILIADGSGRAHDFGFRVQPARVGPYQGSLFSSGFGAGANCWSQWRCVFKRGYRDFVVTAGSQFSKSGGRVSSAKARPFVAKKISQNGFGLLPIGQKILGPKTKKGLSTPMWDGVSSQISNCTP